MNTSDPMLRFLGLLPTTDATRLLGLNPSARIDAAQIEVALERQLSRVYQHSDGQSPEADQVRQRLRAAAEELRRSVASGRLGRGPASPATRAPGIVRSTVPRIQLTTFDRTVLAVLVASGGWNADCRSRLVALAAAHGVSVQGLIRVLTGLAAYARSGGPRLDAQEIASQNLVERPPSVDDSIDQSPVTPALIGQLADRLAAELRREGRWPTIKLSLIFGTVTIVVAVLAMGWLIESSRGPATPTAAVVPAGDSGITHASSTQPATQSSAEPQIAERRILTFRRMPTFLGNGLPVAAAAAADQAPQHIAALDEVGRKISISADPSEAVFRIWDDAIGSIATGWVLMDASARKDAAAKIDEALISAAAAPQSLERLFRALMPPPAPAMNPAEPVDVWRGTWRAGTLGRLAASTYVPPVAVEQARAALGVVFREPAKVNSFVVDATRWLDSATPAMIQSLSTDDDTYDNWELWIGAQRALGGGTRWQKALMDAMAELLESTADVSDAGPAQNVLGRFVSLAMDDPSGIVRDRVIGFFDDESISNDDLWVLTSLMAQDVDARWFDAQLVIPPEADAMHRARVRDSIARVWPKPPPSLADAQAGVIVADAAAAQRWMVAAAEIVQQPRGKSDEDIMRQILLASRVNEAMDELLAKDSTRAMELLDAVEQSLAGNNSKNAGFPLSGAPVRRGQALGVDGQWSAEYAQLGRNAEDRLQSLRGLRNNAGSDLGEIDSRTLVHEAYRGATQDVRTMAQGLIAEQFLTGLNVAMQLLDQFPTAPQTEGVSDMSQRVSGRELPPARAANWPIDARLALVMHALELRPESRSGIDQLADALTQSYLQRLAALKREATPGVVAPNSPAAAAELLAQAWRDRAQVTLASNPVPADLGGIGQRLAVRMELAQGPIQRFVAQQLGVLDLLAYITVAEQPALREDVVRLLSESMQRRVRLNSALAQALDAERTIIMLWKLRLGPQAAEVAEQDGGMS